MTINAIETIERQNEANIDLLSGKVSMLQYQANNTRRYIAEVEKYVTELNITIDARLNILEKWSNIK